MELTVEALRGALDKAAIQELIGSAAQGYQVQIGMQRDSHREALDQIAGAVAQYGFAVAEAFVSEWVNAAAKGAAIGFFAGGSGGALKTRDGSVAVVAGGIGALAGGIAGSFVHEQIARYLARRDPFTGMWHLTQLELPETPQYRFGLA